MNNLENGVLFLRRATKQEPEWLTFLRPHLAKVPKARSTASVSGLLVFQANKRWFAAAFGYGRMLLDPEIVVADFGLRSALNSVDPDELQSIDAKTLEELSVNTRRQLSRGSSITTFELDLHRDLIRSVRGRSTDASFADQVSGAAALQLTGEISFTDITPRAVRALELYSDTSYKSRFGWIDHVRLITDPKQRTKLDLSLEEAIRTNVAEPYLAAPEIVDEDDFGGFQLLDRDGPIVVDLRWVDYLALKNNAPSLVTLKRDRIAVISAASGEPLRQWQVYRSLVFEFDADDDGQKYVLSGGDWFAVDPDYATETRHYIEQFEINPIVLPAAAAMEAEDAYNSRVRDEAPATTLLFDRQLFRATQSQDSIEFCDLLQKPNRIIHVKRKSGSSTLSHLFNQGLVSAELLVFDDGFRNAVSASVDAEPDFAGTIPPGPAVPSNFEIAFAVISRAATGGRHYLPFFSQVSFRRVAEQLTSRGTSSP